MVFNGVQWGSMVFSGVQWCSVVFNGVHWCFFWQPSEPARRYFRSHYLVNVEKALDYLRYRQVSSICSVFTGTDRRNLSCLSLAVISWWFFLKKIFIYDVDVDQTCQYPRVRHCRRESHGHTGLNMDYHSAFPGERESHEIAVVLFACESSLLPPPDSTSTNLVRGRDHKLSCLKTSRILAHQSLVGV